MFLGDSKYYIHRHQKVEARSKSDAVVRTISIGPFRTEKQARSVMAAIRSFNKTTAGRGMNLRLEQTPADNANATCWHVCYGDTVNGHYEKPGSYSWMCDLITCLSKSTLPGCDISSWNTNIDTLRNEMSDVIERSEKVAPPSKKPAPSVVAHVVVKRTKRTADDIRKEKEQKDALKLATDEARKAESVALAARKLAEKAIAKSKPAPTPAPKSKPAPTPAPKSKLAPKLKIEKDTTVFF